ncbi:MAG: hypothetical protein B9J98_03705 [Candidatus Terraquivivens tikiterensis]|uniref:5'-deoxynucleotidase n=1 Tax=Candidatus Terraquivivens tikiterensis TaxID=1980982 RepID=A0A2R7Y5M9_9ARCH|nr:MAG: hypothetical protein B9J98_03705 [Candidatus Terraquivivens tikiterensis]
MALPERLLKFIEHAYTLKEIRRRGWTRRGIPRVESVAEHTFGLALLSMLMADLRGLDAERSIRMALLHDLCESITGDLTPKDRARLGPEKSVEEEKRAIELLLSYLPPELAEGYLDVWKEYNAGYTAEARLVKELDRLERALQAIRYARRKRLRKALKPFWEEFLSISQDGLLRSIVQRAVKGSEPNLTP